MTEQRSGSIVWPVVPTARRFPDALLRRCCELRMEPLTLRDRLGSTTLYQYTRIWARVNWCVLRPLRQVMLPG